MKFFKSLIKFLFAIFVVALVTGGIYTWVVIDNAPTISEAQLKEKANPEGVQDYVTADSIPQQYRDAVTSTEDATFETNNGVNSDGLRALVVSNVKALFGNGVGRGGSSITQQLVKLTAFKNNAEPTPKRKIQEIYLATKLTREYSKDQIFEFYVNKIFQGYNRYGAETISEFYYQKPLKKLSLAQQATIAGIGQTPIEYDLYKNPKAVEERRNIVLLSMFNNNKITEKAYNKAINTKIDDGLVLPN